MSVAVGAETLAVEERRRPSVLRRLFRRPPAVIATAMSVCLSDGPSAATTAMARIGPGNARNRSVIRISTLSTHPPVAPATRPMSPPITTPEAMTISAENQLERIP